MINNLHTKKISHIYFAKLNRLLNAFIILSGSISVFPFNDIIQTYDSHVYKTKKIEYNATILNLFLLWFNNDDVNSKEFLKKNYIFPQGWRNKVNESRIDL